MPHDQDSGEQVISSANLESAYLRHANLQDANLDSTILKRANLRHAEFWDANLENANLERANLRGASLTFAKNLTQEQLDRACGNNATSLHTGLRAGRNCVGWPRR